MAEETNSKLTYFLIGGGIGAVLALIFAPRTGQETRKIISEKRKKLQKNDLDKLRELRKQDFDLGNLVKENLNYSGKITSHLHHLCHLLCL